MYLRCAESFANTPLHAHPSSETPSEEVQGGCAPLKRGLLDNIFTFWYLRGDKTFKYFSIFSGMPSWWWKGNVDSCQAVSLRVLFSGVENN